MQPPSPGQALSKELVTLVRRLRELHTVVATRSRVPLELPAAAVLGRVGEDGPVRASDLADRLLVDLSTVSRQVALLERHGWLVREPDPADRRAQLLRLSPEGRAALVRLVRTRAQVLDELLPGWTTTELAGLTAALARLNHDLSARGATVSAVSRTPPAPRRAPLTAAAQEAP